MLKSMIGLALLLVLANCAPQDTTNVAGEAKPQEVSAPATLTGRGNEPGWRIDIGEKEITLLVHYGRRRVVAPMTKPEVSGNTTSYMSAAEGKPLTATFEKRQCAYNMSGMPHPMTVVVMYDGRELRGCAGNPLDLLQGEWVIADNATIRFGMDGSVSGKSYCNSYSGLYALATTTGAGYTSETLIVKPGAATLMACAEDLMKKERDFTTLLSGVRRFEIARDGGLVLHTAWPLGKTIQAKRKP